MSEEELHESQVVTLERKIKWQNFKIFFAAAMIAALFFAAMWLLWGEQPCQQVAVLHIGETRPPSLSQTFTSIAHPRRGVLQVAPISGRVVQLYKNIGDHVVQDDILLQIDDVYLLADIEGTVESYPNFPWKLGSFAQQAKPVCHIIDTSSVMLFVEIPDGKFPRDWQEKRNITDIRFQEIPSRTFSGIIESLTFYGTKAAMVVDIPNPGGDIRQEMKVELHYEREPEPITTMIPGNCLIPGEQSVVYVVKNGQCEMRRVTIQKRNDQEVWISSGLQKGDMVVVGPPKNLRDGQRVQTRKN